LPERLDVKSRAVSSEEHTDPPNPSGLLRLGGERRGEEHRTRASEERTAVDHWFPTQTVCELGARESETRGAAWLTEAARLGERME